ncbi:hypothetical protein [Sphingomonas sp. ABOLE]|uniref:DUF6950 family protein n=1 Tax=Sphingomonas sp. ABOLE TaxID=1985878 RepID=UPI0019D082A0|nr:hypothetical protein [Sphingomonas sp. ABOLE]
MEQLSMTRLLDWEARLADYLASVADRPMAWGSHDCALHAAHAILALTGEDHATAYRGRYQTARGAARALRRQGHADVEAQFDVLFPAIAPAFAQRGDIVQRGDAVGVCIGAEALFVGEEGEREGLVRVPRREWTKAWAIR